MNGLDSFHNDREGTQVDERSGVGLDALNQSLALCEKPLVRTETIRFWVFEFIYERFCAPVNLYRKQLDSKRNDGRTNSNKKKKKKKKKTTTTEQLNN
jgi:hypothetical protein